SEFPVYSRPCSSSCPNCASGGGFHGRTISCADRPPARDTARAVTEPTRATARPKGRRDFMAKPCGWPRGSGGPSEGGERARTKHRRECGLQSNARRMERIAVMLPRERDKPA